MAKGDLYKLAMEAKDFLSQDVDFYRRNVVDTQTHVYTVDSGQVRNQVYIEVENKLNIKPLPTAIKNRLRGAINTYTADIWRRFRGINRKTSEITVNGPPSSFTVIIENSSGSGTTPFQVVNNTKLQPQKDLVKEINKILQEELKGHQKFDSTHFLDTGHVTAVSDRFIDDALFDIGLEADRSAEVAGLVAKTLRINLASKFVGSSKNFLIEVKEEAKSNNRSKGSTEKKRLDKVRQRLAAFIEKHDWYNQEGSDSEIEFITSELINAGLKSKHAKGKKQKADTSSADVSLKVTSQKKITSSKEQIKITAPRKRKPKPPLHLINLLNAKLSEEIRKRMTYPRLQYKTGRFAGSVRVVGIESTPAGYPSISYTYMRNPYQVFERGIGRPPWNTPDRDPRALIDQSIRAIATSLITTRFYTRRV